MSISFADAATGWSGTCLTNTGGTAPPPGGLVLQEVRHDQHNFARDLRMVGIRLKIEEVTPAGAVTSTSSVFVPLSDPPFTLGPFRTLTPTTVTVSLPLVGSSPVQYLREAAEVPQFNSYFRNGANHVAYGFAADYTLPASWFSSRWSNCEMAGLWISQRFLLSRYANLPPHEPSGALMAARFHPVGKYSFAANPAVDRRRNYQRIASIRFDYRLELRLDRHYNVATNAGLPQLGQNAGLFRDNDMISIPATSVARVVFAAIEKPLVLEVWSYGLWEGTPTVGPRGIYGGYTAARTWDNSHWFPTQPAGAPIISAPGAFHAAHTHWRWGGAGFTFRSRIPEIDDGGVPGVVQSRRWGNNAARVLVDPDVWIQTIRVGVVKNETSLNPNTSGVTLNSLSREDWPTLFTSLRATPADIYAGDDIVFWYSTEVHASTYFPAEYSMAIFPVQIVGNATYRSKDAGNVFIHGIFFAHNAEQGGGSVGARTPEHWPRSVATLRASPAWYRPAT